LWYFIPDGDSIEYLLYDFNASVGEKITLNNPWAVGEVDAYVTSKDSILIDGAYKSRLGIGARPNEFWEYWIEDVGCLGGLFYSCFFIFDTGFELTCTYLYDEFQYNLGYHEYCGCFKSTSVITKSIGPDVSIFPNPSSGLLSIQNKTEEPVRIYFYSSEGRIIELVELPNNSRKSIEMNHQGAVFVNIVGENINKTQQIQVVK
jgi:hypothetical protein